ncbi:sodium/calcium exchanger, putative, partial [Ixodes scapularis]
MTGSSHDLALQDVPNVELATPGPAFHVSRTVVKTPRKDNSWPKDYGRNNEGLLTSYEQERLAGWEPRELTNPRIPLVFLAYAADRGIFWPGRRGRSAQKQLELQTTTDTSVRNGNAVAPVSTPGTRKQFFPNGELNRESLLDFIREIRKHPGLTDEDAACLASAQLAEQQRHTRMWYRVGAIRDLTGGRRTKPSISEKLQHTADEVEQGKLLKPVPESESKDVALIEFNASSCAVLEKAGKVDVIIRRKGKIDCPATCRVETIDGTAVAGEDYMDLRQMVLFQPGEVQRKVSVQIVDDNQWEPDETFFLRLSLPLESSNVMLGRKSVMERSVGTRERSLGLRWPWSARKAPTARGSSTGAPRARRPKKARTSMAEKASWCSSTARPSKNIEIPIVDDFRETRRTSTFEVELFRPVGPDRAWATFTKTTVTITSDEEFNTIVNRLMLMTNTNVDKLRLHSETWVEQMKDAMNVNGGDIENATAVDYVMHFLTFGWKVIFALVPPTGFLGGWLTFFVSLGAIGLLTAIVGDLAGIFGCLVGLEDTITAITFVALGTSLPDLFASKGCARSEKYADNAIGNVTGSNSVNVFLGLGIPWVVAAAYWQIK